MEPILAVCFSLSIDILTEIQMQISAKENALIEQFVLSDNVLIEAVCIRQFPRHQQDKVRFIRILRLIAGSKFESEVF